MGAGSPVTPPAPPTLPPSLVTSRRRPSLLGHEGGRHTDIRGMNRDSRNPHPQEGCFLFFYDHRD